MLKHWRLSSDQQQCRYFHYYVTKHFKSNGKIIVTH